MRNAKFFSLGTISSMMPDSFELVYRGDMHLFVMVPLAYLTQAKVSNPYVVCLLHFGITRKPNLWLKS